MNEKNKKNGKNQKPDNKKDKSPLEKAGEDLFNFAIDREDIKAFAAAFPEDKRIHRTAVEYELQILKLITVGWGISYFLENESGKNDLALRYWNDIHEFSKELSSTAELFVGKDFDYFQILKKRLDHYVEQLAARPEAAEPAAIIGPEFAGFCGDAQNPFAIMTGSKMFKLTIASIKEYLSMISGAPVSLH